MAVDPQPVGTDAAFEPRSAYFTRHYQGLTRTPRPGEPPLAPKNCGFLIGFLTAYCRFIPRFLTVIVYIFKARLRFATKFRYYERNTRPFKTPPHPSRADVQHGDSEPAACDVVLSKQLTSVQNSHSSS